MERNRQLVLAAARRVFLARGYAGASLEAIADEAGFSKGVVYSQFDSKADLFLALLEQRIAERAEQNARLADEMGGAGSAELVAAALLRLADRVQLAEPDWALLVVEFRAHAARDPELNRRYTLAHAQTVDRLAETLVRVHERLGVQPPAPPHVLAEFVLAIGSGVALERAANPEALPTAALGRLVVNAVTAAASTDPPARAARRTRRAVTPAQIPELTRGT